MEEIKRFTEELIKGIKEGKFGFAVRHEFEILASCNRDAEASISTLMLLTATEFAAKMNLKKHPSDAV